MHFLVFALLILFGAFSSTFALEQATEKHVTIYSWPVASSSPQELASIGYNTRFDQTVISKYSPPTNAEDLVRVGLYDPKTSDWTGVVTAANSFDAKFQQKIELHVDDESQVWHVGFTARPKPEPQAVNVSKGKSKGKPEPEVPQVVVEIIRPKPGPTPHLNQPVVLRPDGKLPEKEPEKTFLQKYWWAIAGIVLLQVLMAGGTSGEGGEK